MASYLVNALKAAVPQNQPLPGTNQEKNNAGGYTFVVDDMTRVRRFLTLGTEGGTYYVGEVKLTKENAGAIMKLIAAGRGVELVNELLQFSLQGRSAKQDTLVFALALCARLGDAATKKAAYDAVPKICRIPTTLFAFVSYAEAVSTGTGWGRAQRRAIAQWYNDKEPRDVVFTATKYKNRHGWTHTDVLRLAHVKPASPEHETVFKFIVKGYDALAAPAPAEDFVDLMEDEYKSLPLIRAIVNVSRLTDPNTDADAAIALIKEFNLAREHLPTELLKSVPIWSALLSSMPMTAMIRNLGKMTAIGLLAPNSDAALVVAQRLQDEARLRKARIHPFNVLVAYHQYAAGRGDKGSLTWTPVQIIVAALEEAYYLAFHNVEPTGKRFVLGIDVSGSMGGYKINGSSTITARDGAAAMAMLTARTEKQSVMMGFCHKFVDLKINNRHSLEEVQRKISGLPFGATDCALPMTWALKNKVKADVFVVYTDNETYFGKIHPAEALRNYRREMNIPDAKLIVVGFAATKFSIADPNDPGMLDMAGFDSAAPQIMADFINGRI